MSIVFIFLTKRCDWVANIIDFSLHIIQQTSKSCIKNVKLKFLDSKIYKEI